MQDSTHQELGALLVRGRALRLILELLLDLLHEEEVAGHVCVEDEVDNQPPHVPEGLQLEVLEDVDARVLVHGGEEHVEVKVLLDALIVVRHGPLGDGVLVVVVVVAVVSKVMHYGSYEDRLHDRVKGGRREGRVKEKGGEEQAKDGDGGETKRTWTKGGVDNGRGRAGEEEGGGREREESGGGCPGGAHQQLKTVDVLRELRSLQHEVDSL
eukprot:767187-Hanusia_phi.AAC.2